MVLWTDIILTFTHVQHFLLVGVDLRVKLGKWTPVFTCSQTLCGEVAYHGIKWHPLLKVDCYNHPCTEKHEQRIAQGNMSRNKIIYPPFSILQSQTIQCNQIKHIVSHYMDDM